MEAQEKNKNQSCAVCRQTYSISERDSNFYQKIGVPSPTLCPTCRMIRRLSYRNDRSLYQTTCALTGKKMISMYNPDNGFTVYEYRVWWSDDWDPYHFGRNYDSSRSFFEQFRELQRAVPRFNLFNRDSENCDYVNYAPHCKDCYLLFGSWFNDNCYFGQSLNECKDCVDNLFLDHGELCYENIDCRRNYNSCFVQNSSNLVDCSFCYDCHQLNNCIGCYNLRQKEYHIDNKPVSKSEFERLREYFGSYRYLTEYAEQFHEKRKRNAIHKYATILNCEQVTGDFIFESRNALHCFSTYRSQDVAHSTRCFDQKDSYDFEGGGKGELVYEGMSNDFAYNSVGSMTCENLVNAHYCDLCFNCENCFGCVGLRNAKFCILNKQYPEADYHRIVKQITAVMTKQGEWGEFFPTEASLFAYNETLAQEYFPLDADVARSRGYRWKNEIRQSVPSAVSLPDRVGDMDDTVVGKTLVCNRCSKNYRLILAELQFYRKFSIPIPRSCPDCRHFARMAARNPRRLWARSCASCETRIESSFSPDGVEQIYCEACYQKLII